MATDRTSTLSGAGRRGTAWRALSGLVAVVIFAAGSRGCGRADAPEVVLYVSADEHIARQVVSAFEEATGIRVRLVGDTELKKTTGLVERLRAEHDHPQADVFWSSEVFQTIALADEGVLAPFRTDRTVDWPSRFRDPQDRWYGFAARARVIVFAPDRLPPERRPRTWTDLTQSHLRGRIVMADPRFGTTGGHLGAMKAYWDRAALPGYYAAFLMGLRDNEVRLLPSGNAGVVQAVADGEADVGLTDTDDVWAAQTRGLAVDLIYPAHSHEDETGNGTLVIPNTVALVAGGPNPAAAIRLADFLLSADVERLLVESVSHNVPIRPDLAEAYPQYAVPDPLDVNLARAAAAREDAVQLAMRILTTPVAAPDDPSDDPTDDPTDD